MQRYAHQNISYPSKVIYTAD